MSAFCVLIIIIGGLVLTNVLAVCLFWGCRKEKAKLENEVGRVHDDLEYYMNLDRIKKEGIENYNEKSKGLHSGDVHSRNSAAADILRNGQN